jgi:uncharacterized GH25 family protein
MHQTHTYGKEHCTMKKHILCMTAFALVIAIAAPVSAHMLWLNVNNYQPKVGETVYVEIGFGHKYPRDEVLKPGRMQQVQALDPEGRSVALEEVFPSFYKFTPQKEGTHRIVAALKPGFVSNTTQGRKLGNRKTLPEVVSCFAFRMMATALITCGGKSGGQAGAGEEGLEILALKDPAELKAGESLPLKVVFQGKPLGDAELKATCAQCDADEEHPWVQQIKTDAQGLVRIKPSAKGPWGFIVSHRIPYSNPDECDKYFYQTSLTVGF